MAFLSVAVDVGLEDELRSQLHGARVAGEGLLRVVEVAAAHSEIALRLTSSVPEGVDLIDRARDELVVIEDVERLRLELESVALSEVDPLDCGHINVICRAE